MLNSEKDLLDSSIAIKAAMLDRISDAERFNPKEVHVETKNTQMIAIINRIEHGEIELYPDFQRNPDVWDTTKQSILIESMMLNIPIPAFYMDATNENKWIVIDGLQRLNTILHFVVKQDLKLKQLRILKEYEGCKFDKLPVEMQRRINETDVVIYQIREGTPEVVRYEIFNRINTGGTPLSSQEIRHALHPGPFLDFLAKLAASKKFQTAINNGISPKRMVDRECVLRFLAFTFLKPEFYIGYDFNLFLHKAMEVGNRLSTNKLAEYEARFYRAMDVAYRIFKDRTFRKYDSGRELSSRISRSLLDVVSVNIDSLTYEQQEVLVQRRTVVNERLERLLKEDKEFETSVHRGISSGAKELQYRFSAVKHIFEEIINA